MTTLILTRFLAPIDCSKIPALIHIKSSMDTEKVSYQLKSLLFGPKKQTCQMKRYLSSLNTFSKKLVVRGLYGRHGLRSLVDHFL
jgi:hypothetical protein